jgi:hypothetical protein
MTFDQHLINLLIVLLPLAIFIGRAITNARNRHEQRNQETAPKERVHQERIQRERAFREEGYESSSPALSRGTNEYFKGLQVSEQPNTKPARRKETAKPRKVQDGLTSALDKTILTPTETAAPAARSTTAGGRAASSEQGGFAFNLKHLSPLKQAVVMAEILGTPKGLKDN